MLSLANPRFRADLTLLTVSLVWGSAFVVQRLVANHIGVFLFNGLRFLLGALVLLPFTRLPNKRLFKQNAAQIFLAGALLFSGAALQQLGLRYTTAGNAGFVTGLYVVLIPIFLAVGWRLWPGRITWVASIMAVIGLFLLSTGGQLRINYGDRLELAGAFMWAFHVILIGKLVQRVEVMPIAVGQYLACAILSLLVAFVFESNSIESLHSGIWAIVYTGVLSVGLGYTLQAKGQQVAPPSDAAIILSTEAVFAALFGWIFLAESLSFQQMVGAGLLLAAMILSQVGAFTIHKDFKESSRAEESI